MNDKEPATTSSLLLRFRIDWNWNGEGKSSYPLFHRWLPNSDADAIELPVQDNSVQLKVWFERRGIVDGQFIRYSATQNEIDPDIMSRQGVLIGGSLLALVKITNLSETELTAIQQSQTGDAQYRGLGKRLVKVVYPPLA